MKNKLVYLLALLFLWSCSEKPAKTEDPFDGNVVVYAPQPVAKTVNNKKIFAHVMPWFDTKETNGDNRWGYHWKMQTKNPDNILPNGQRDIAAHYYPLIGPYASGDPAVVEYQLLLMKLSGIDGVLIDWPGTMYINDYYKNRLNSEKMIALLEKVGLKYAIVYEDQNLKNAANKTQQSQADMTYMQTNYFPNSTYEKMGDKAWLLTFGPQELKTPADWDNAFSILTTKPAFFPLWGFSPRAGANNVAGEFAWVVAGNISLNNFYNNYSGTKIGCAYPGFKNFYTEGGVDNNANFIIDHNGLNTFTQTLDLALAQNLTYIQLTTWNDYGEGTMIEPTKEFGYGFLTTLQSKLGVSSLTQTDLEMIAKLYQLRKDRSANANDQKKLDQVFYYIVSLQMDKAKSLLNSM